MLTSILLIAAMIILLGFAISGPMGAPWVPAFKKDVDSMLDDSSLKRGEHYIELGCGDGRLVAAAAKRGAKAIGYEINPVLWLVAMLRVSRMPNAKVRLGNFWAKDLSNADVVVAFLMPKFMGRLEQKTTAELKPGARLASYIYKLPKKHPSLKRDHWFIYTF